MYIIAVFGIDDEVLLISVKHEFGKSETQTRGDLLLFVVVLIIASYD